MSEINEKSSKKEVIIFNIITCVLFNKVYLVCDIYPKHIVEFKNIFSLFAILINIIFHFLFFLFITVIYNEHTHILSKDFIFRKSLNKKNIIKISKVILFQTLIDLLNFFILFYFKNYSYVFVDILTLINVLFVYFLLIEKKENIFKGKYASCLIIVLLTIITIISIVLDVFMTEDYFFYCKKYEYASENLQSFLLNSDFIFSFKNFIFDTVINLVVIFFHLYLNIHNNYKISNNKVKNAVKLFVLLIGAFILVFIKVIILPNNSIASFQTKGTKNELYNEQSNFDFNTKTVCIERVIENSSTKNVFIVTKNEISYNGEVVECFYSSDNNSAKEINKVGNEIIIDDNFNKITVLETDVYIYKNNICFVQDNIPIIVNFDEIKDCNENKIITEVCKTFLENGNISIFEYCCSYLQKYDSEFLNEYIIRYKNESFTNEEIRNLDKQGIRYEFIVDIAKTSTDLQ